MWEIRPYTPKDKDQIIQLFKDVFDQGMSVEQWQWHWQFPKNPFSRPIIWVAEAPGGNL